MTTAEARPMRQKLSDKVRSELLGLIDGGTLPPGEPLPSERALMERFKVGRPAIREAMQSLETIGLIEIRHGGRARVAEPSVGRMVDQVSTTMKHLLSNSPASLENLKEARATFEREMARIAAKRRSPTDLARLRVILADQHDAAAETTGDPARFRTLDGLFHREIAALSGNPIFTALIDALFRWLADFHVDLVSVPGLEQLTLAEHAQILAALERSDPEAAATAMSDHLLRANALYRQSHLPRA
jgi:GntR family transcriptional regulator, sialic acid-inducible nan operon repressor